jgi:hypothetical protein
MIQGFSGPFDVLSKQGPSGGGESSGSLQYQTVTTPSFLGLSECEMLTRRAGPSGLAKSAAWLNRSSQLDHVLRKTLKRRTG